MRNIPNTVTKMMGRFIAVVMVICSSTLSYAAQVDEQAFTLKNYEECVTYRNVKLYRVAEGERVTISSTVGAITFYDIDREHTLLSRPCNPCDLPNKFLGDNCIHEIKVGNGDVEVKFFITSNPDINPIDGFIYKFDDENLTAGAIGLTETPVYLRVPEKVVKDGRTYTVTELCTNLLIDSNNDIRRFNTGSSVETIGNLNGWVQSAVFEPAVKKILASSNFVGRGIFLGTTPPIGSSGCGVAIVPNTNYNFYNQKVLPNLSNSFYVDGIMYVPTDMGERKCQILDWNNEALHTETLNIKSVKYKNVEFSIQDIAAYALLDLPELKSISIDISGKIERHSIGGPVLEDVAFLNCEFTADSPIGDTTSLKKLVFENDGSIYFTIGGSKLEEVYFNNNGYLAENILARCSGLRKVVLNNKGDIGNGAFKDCVALSEVVFENIKGIGEKLFSGCSSLKYMDYPETLKSIPLETFKDCTSLQFIDLHNGLYAIRDFAFSGCTSLESITIPETVNSIGFNVWNDCQALKNLIFSALSSTENINKEPIKIHGYNDMRFSGNDTEEITINLKKGESLTFSPYVTKGLELLVYIDGSLLKKYTNEGNYQHVIEATNDREITLKCVANGKADWHEYSGIRYICVYPTVQPNGSLTILNYFNTSTSLFKNAPLETLVFDRQVSYDYDYPGTPDSPFRELTTLKSVSFGNQVTSIGNNMLRGGTAIEKCVVGESVERIGSNAFEGCSAIKEMDVYAPNPPYCGGNALTSINKWDCTLHVLNESIDAYKIADQWKEFFLIEGDLVSGVENVPYLEGPTNSTVYSIDGKLIRKSSEEIPVESLPKGLYIINGKKVII